MQPYVIKQGDFLASVADDLGFDADTVWNDGANADLRGTRSDPYMLCPTDVLQVPDDADEKPETHSLTTGSTNSFVAADSPAVTVNVRFTSCLCMACDGQPLAGEAYEVEGADIPPGSLDGDGYFTAQIPLSLDQFVLKLPNRSESYNIKVGHLDPANTPTGAWQRLAMLGLVESPTFEADEVDDDGLTEDFRYALYEFQWAHDLPKTADLDDATVAKLVERAGR